MTNNKPPIWFWVFTIPMLILGIMGVLQVDSVWGEEMTEPFWAQASYTTGIIGIFLGSVFLLLRKKTALYFYVFSALGFMAHRFWLFALSGTLDTLAPYAPATLLISILLALIGIWVVRHGIQKGWIRV